MTQTENAIITDFVKAARIAHDEADAARNSEREQERITQIIHIGKQLADRGITPVGDPFTNRASGKPCVPVVRGGWDEETDSQVHYVAVEWDSDAAELGMPLVADGDLDEGWSALWLYPAGRLTGLADIGRAVADGGRPHTAPPTARDRVNRAIGSVNADYAGPNAEAILAAADAVCEALLDIAEAIRASRAGA